MKIFHLCLLLLCVTSAAFANDRHQREGDFGYSVASAENVDEAVTEVIARLRDQGFDIVGVIDHAENADSVGLELRPTQLILFSQKKIDRQLIRRSQTTGIDLPLKMLIYEDSDENIRLNYNAPGYLADRHKMAMLDPLLTRVGKTLGQFGVLEDGLISVTSQQSVANTVAKLVEVLQEAGFFIPFVIDHQRYAGRGQMRPNTLIIFGNPAIGTQLMQNSRDVGLDLPQKYLVWEDDVGEVRISYNNPFFLAGRHGLDVQGEEGLQTLLNNIANALAEFASLGATQ